MGAGAAVESADWVALASQCEAPTFYFMFFHGIVTDLYNEISMLHFISNNVRWQNYQHLLAILLSGVQITW
jgi:hypothetical protein